MVSQGVGATKLDGRQSFAELCDDESAFAQWYAGALPRVFGFVHGRTGGDVALAEEIVAQAFLEAVRARRSFHERSDPVTWICAIARNRLVDHYRREARRQTSHLRVVVTDISSPDSSLDRLEERADVVAALAELPALERTVLTMRYLDGYSVREIGHQIGRTERATDSLLLRARDRIRRAHPGGIS
jgi:RNA polymerase sigma-70 factor (ECF subfamily)